MGGGGAGWSSSCTTTNEWHAASTMAVSSLAWSTEQSIGNEEEEEEGWVIGPRLAPRVGLALALGLGLGLGLGLIGVVFPDWGEWGLGISRTFAVVITPDPDEEEDAAAADDEVEEDGWVGWAKTGALALMTPTGTSWSVVRVPVLSNKQCVTVPAKRCGVVGNTYR